MGLSPYLEVLEGGENVGLLTTLITLDEGVEDVVSVHCHGSVTLVTLEAQVGVVHLLVHGPVLLAGLEGTDTVSGSCEERRLRRM